MDSYSLSEKITKVFTHFNVNINIPYHTEKEGLVRYTVNLKRSTTVKNLYTHAPDVQAKLKLPLFQVVQEGFDIYLVVSEQEIEYPRLAEILRDKKYHKMAKQKKLPYFIGHDAMGRPVVVDLEDLPHLLVGGSSNSGKSVGLQALIASTAYITLPSKVNLILIDVGANDLMVFDGMPHLSCPVVQNCNAAYHTLIAVEDEMERRISLGHTSPDKFKQLPRLLLVIDEVPALFTSQNDKETSQAIATAISSLLRRGRHAKIHLVLAAQNPTYPNMKIDLGNITARIAFRCAKKNFSETILGVGGAENLRGPGSLLLKSPQSSGTEWVQGIYVKPKELRQLVQDIKDYVSDPAPDKFELAIPDNGPILPPDTIGNQISCSLDRKRVSKEDQLFADVILWALERDSISIHALMTHYRLGWNRASRLVERLEELGIVDRPEGKLPRDVIPNDPEDIPEELIGFLQDAGYSQDAIIDAFCNRLER